MEPICDSVQDDETLKRTMPLAPRQLLPPKGACWYCDRPLDSVRRFCGKDCSAAFDEDAALHG